MAFNSNLYKKFAARALCHLKEKWCALIETIIDGSCMCHKDCTLIYCTTVEECDDTQPGTDTSFFDLNSGHKNKFNKKCKIKEVTENISLAVFFKEEMFFEEGKKFVKKDGIAEIICTYTNMKKLIQASEIIIDTDIHQVIENKYVRVTAPESCGIHEDCKYFLIKFKRCS